MLCVLLGISKTTWIIKTMREQLGMAAKEMRVWMSGVWLRIRLLVSVDIQGPLVFWAPPLTGPLSRITSVYTVQKSVFKTRAYPPSQGAFGACTHILAVAAPTLRAAKESSPGKR